MKIFLIPSLMIILSAWSPGGCANFSSSPPAVAPVIASAELYGDKALYAAEAAYKGFLIATNAAVDSGQLKGANATRTLAVVRTAKGYLDKARAARRVGDQAAVTAAALAALVQIGSVAPQT